MKKLEMFPTADDFDKIDWEKVKQSKPPNLELLFRDMDIYRNQVAQNKFKDLMFMDLQK